MMPGSVNPDPISAVASRGINAARTDTQVRTLYVRYEGRRHQAVLEAEWYPELYDQGLSLVHLACPMCMKGTPEDLPPVDAASGAPTTRALSLRQEVKAFTVDAEGRLTVHEPVGCPYCRQWTVKIRDGVAYDCAG